MTQETAPDPAAAPPHDVRDRIIMFVIVILFAAILVAFNGGHPRSLWFYPYMTALAFSLAFYRPKLRRENWTKGELGPVQPIPAALKSAAIRGLATGLIVFLAFRLGYWVRSDAWMCVAFTLWPTADEYRYKRGLKYSMWVIALVMLGVLVAEILLVRVFKIIPR